MSHRGGPPGHPPHAHAARHLGYQRGCCGLLREKVSLRAESTVNFVREVETTHHQAAAECHRRAPLHAVGKCR